MQAIALDASRAAAVFLDPRLPSRFWKKCVPCPISGCWIWIAAQTKEEYGAIAVGYATVYAHRFAYEALVGPLPPGKRGRRRAGDLEIDHRCRVRCCVNPSHLQLVTRRENVLRGESPAARVVRFNMCSAGHALSAGNVYRRSGRRRDCLICTRRRRAAHYQRTGR